MTLSISAAQSALAQLTGQSKSASASQSAVLQGPEVGLRKHPPPPPPQDHGGAIAAQTPAAALAQSVFAALASNFVAGKEGSLSASLPEQGRAMRFAALDSNHDAGTGADEWGRFVKTLSEAFGATTPSADTQPGPALRPAAKDQAKAGTAVFSLMEALITAQAQASGQGTGQSTAVLIAQFTKLLAQTA